MKEVSFENRLQDKFIGGFKESLKETVAHEVEEATNNFREKLIKKAEEYLVRMGLEVARFVDISHHNDRLVNYLNCKRKGGGEIK